MGSQATAKKPLIQWQPPMKKMLIAMTPLVLASLYFFGWKSIAVLAVVQTVGFLTEWIFNRVYKMNVSSAVLVTNTLFALILPPAIPLWMAALGSFISVLFGKMVFGGFGKNIFNPALVGRAFLYISFGMYMTGKKAFVEPFQGLFGGLLSWSSDAVSAATPIKIIRETGSFDPLKLLAGNTSGCLGETSALLVLLGGIYLILKKTASYRIILSGLISMLLLQTILWKSGVSGALDPLSATLSGGFLLGLIFMATDPISAAQTDLGRWIYGGIIGFLTVLIRTFSAWPEGIMFAILLGNMFAPIIDYAIRQRQSKGKGA